MTETQNLLTIDMAAEYLHCTPETVRRMLRRGELRGVKLGRLWRVPREVLRRVESRALDEAPARREYSSREYSSSEYSSSEQTKSAAAILSGLNSDDAHKRNAAIIAFAQADAQTSALVEERIAQSVAEYSATEDDLSDWRALDGEPFHFPEETAAKATA